MSGSQRDVQAGVVSAVGSIGLATLTSRLLGFVRDMVLARAFGAGPLTDAFFVAFRIPNLLRRLLAEGALSSAVIPVFSDALARGGRQAFERLARAVIGAGTLSLCLVSALGMALAPWIVAAMTPGWAAEPRLVDLAVQLTRIMFPYLLLVGLAALGAGILNVHGRFFTAALGPAVMNVAMILAVLLLARRFQPPILALTVGVLVGGLGQVLVQVPEIRRLGLPVRPSSEWRHPALATIGARMVPAAFGLAAVQVTVLVNTLLASLLPGGAISFLYYADRVMEFPLGVFGIALATAALPSMSAQAARGDHRGLKDTTGFALGLSAFIAVPAAVGLLALGQPVVQLLFQRGAFGAADARATAQALAGYALGLPAFSATRIAAQAFYALGDTRVPVRVGFAGVVINVGLALWLMWPLQHAGLALASSLSAYVNFAGLLWLLQRRIGALDTGALVRAVARALGASAPLLVWCLWVRPHPSHEWGLAGATLAAMAGGLALYAATAAALRAPELSALLGLVRRRL